MSDSCRNLTVMDTPTGKKRPHSEAEFKRYTTATPEMLMSEMYAENGDVHNIMTSGDVRKRLLVSGNIQDDPSTGILRKTCSPNFRWPDSSRNSQLIKISVTECEILGVENVVPLGADDSKSDSSDKNKDNTNVVNGESNVDEGYDDEKKSDGTDSSDAAKTENASDSETLPPLCTAEISDVIVGLESQVKVKTVDYQGAPRTGGGDPVSARLLDENDDVIGTSLEDHDDGTYDVVFTPWEPGHYQLYISIFDRQIKGSPFLLKATEHNNPIVQVGSRGMGDLEFNQPVKVLLDQKGHIFVLDTGNSRITEMDADWRFVRHITCDGLDRQGCTGFALCPTGRLVIVNWRTRCVTELDRETGDVIRQFTSPEFVLPIDIAVNSRGEFVISDDGAGRVLVFDADGYLKFRLRIGVDVYGQPIPCHGHRFVAIGNDDEIIVADNTVRVFARSGRLLYEISVSGMDDGYYGGVTVDHHGNILATKSEKLWGAVEVFNYEKKMFQSIDSHTSKLKRPSGLTVTRDHHVIVADLGNNCIKKYRYK